MKIVLLPSRNSISYKTRHYLLYDMFITDRAAGAVNGTSSEPIGGPRTGTDTNGKISIGSGVLNVATGTANFDGVYWQLQTRLSGKSVIGTLIYPADSQACRLGWHASASPSQITDGFSYYLTNLYILSNAVANLVGIVTYSTYQLCVTMRSNGVFYFIKGGTFTNWTLLYVSGVGSTDRYPVVTVGGGASVSQWDNIRVPKRLFIPVPLQSDGFSASTTDGKGNAEQNGAVGTVWVDRVGTVGRSGTTAIATALSGGIAICTLPAGSAHVLHQANVTRGTTGVGIILRYVDVDNYVYIKRVASNVVCIKRIAGSETTLINAAATEVAASPILGIFDVSTLRAFYNNAAVGAAVTIADAGIANSGEMGLIFFDTDSVVDNLQIFARGNEGQYSGLDSL